MKRGKGSGVGNISTSWYECGGGWKVCLGIETSPLPPPRPLLAATAVGFRSAETEKRITRRRSKSYALRQAQAL